MNIIHVLAFHRVATAGSFTIAARLAGVSQPTLSAQVRALERSAGASFFERSGRGVRLTAAGEQLFAATRRLAEAMEEVGRLLAAGRSPARGHLRISADSAVHVLPVLTELKKTAASLGFSLNIDNSAAVMARVLKGESDVGVMARSTADQRLFSTMIRQDRLVLLVGKRDPLAERKRARLTDLSGRDLVVRERGSITREVAEARLASGGIKTGQVFDVGTREAVGEAVAAGFGIGLAFASEVGRDPRLVPVRIHGADVAVAEYAICLSERRSLGAVAKFLETARRLAIRNGWLTDRGDAGA
ncbi:MAG: LysR family transcriptional regulator [Hyphomicrobiaceae bacterium]|nr:LysR family transcriptional regulator [Hyphomicrobiaceae bacterium]